MKKIAAFLLAALLITAVTIGGTAAYATQADVETQVHTTGKVDIAFDNMKLDASVKANPGSTVDKTVKIENKAGSNPAWVWFTVTVPAVGEYPLVTVTGTDPGWELLSTKVENNLCIYTLGYKTALAAGETTTPGITALEFAGQIDRIDGTFCWVVNGVATPILAISEDFNIRLDACAVEKTAELSSLELAYEAGVPTP